MTDQTETNKELEIARYIAETIGDKCGTVFVNKEIMLRKDMTHEENYNISVFHGNEIAAHVAYGKRLDQAALEAVRKFSEYMEGE